MVQYVYLLICNQCWHARLDCHLNMIMKWPLEITIIFFKMQNIFRIFGFYASKIADFDTQNKLTPNSTPKFTEMTLISFNEFWNIQMAKSFHKSSHMNRNFTECFDIFSRSNAILHVPKQSKSYNMSIFQLVHSLVYLYLTFISGFTFECLSF